MQKNLMLAATILAATTGFAQAEARKIQDVSGWEIYRDPSMGNGCYMTSEFEDGSLMMLGFDLEVDKAFASVFSPDLGDVEDGATYPVEMAMNGETYEADAVGLDGDDSQDGLLVFFESEDFLVDLAQGVDFRLSQGDNELVALDLAASKAAVLATLDCVTSG